MSARDAALKALAMVEAMVGPNDVCAASSSSIFGRIINRHLSRTKEEALAASTGCGYDKLLLMELRWAHEDMMSGYPMFDTMTMVSASRLRARWVEENSAKPDRDGD